MRVNLVQKSTAVVLVEDAGESPRVVLKGLDIVDFDAEHIARFGALDFEWSREVMDLAQIHSQDVVCGVVVLDLTTSPVDTFNLDGFAVLDCAAEGN